MKKLLGMAVFAAAVGQFAFVDSAFAGRYQTTGCGNKCSTSDKTHKGSSGLACCKDYSGTTNGVRACHQVRTTGPSCSKKK